MKLNKTDRKNINKLVRNRYDFLGANFKKCSRNIYFQRECFYAESFDMIVFPVFKVEMVRFTKEESNKTKKSEYFPTAVPICLEHGGGGGGVLISLKQ